MLGNFVSLWIVFVQACDVMPILNEMVHSVSKDEEFLKTTLAQASEYDEFTANLLRTYNKTKTMRDNRTEISVGVHRSDYMFDEPSGRLLQASRVLICRPHLHMSPVTRLLFQPYWVYPEHA